MDDNFNVGTDDASHLPEVHLRDPGRYGAVILVDLSDEMLAMERTVADMPENRLWPEAQGRDTSSHVVARADKNKEDKSDNELFVRQPGEEKLVNGFIDLIAETEEERRPGSKSRPPSRTP